MTNKLKDWKDCGCQKAEYPHWSRVEIDDGVPYCTDCGLFYSRPAPKKDSEK
jgi:hypothetical protein